MIDSNLALKLIVTCSLSVFLIACGGKAGSKTYPTIDPEAPALKPVKTSLELPPDLIGTANDAVIQQDLTEADVIPDIIGISFQSDGSSRWLEIDAPAEEVWPRLVTYWGILGASLVVNDPKSGIMETDWVHQEETGSEKNGFFKSNLLVSIFTDITDQETSLDKYTLRIERKDHSKTLVFLSHRGSKKLQVGTSSIATHPEWEWVETDENQEKVQTVLQSIGYSLDPENV
jgi:uncharacterized lipoprotein